MKRAFRTPICIICSMPVLLLVAATTALQADTIKLIDGSVLVGKVINENAKRYVIANDFGTFEVKKKHARKVYVTRSYQEDVAIQKKLGKQVDEATIRKNIIAGETAREKLASQRQPAEQPAKKGDSQKQPGSALWYYGRLSVSGTYCSTFLTELFPSKQVSSVLPAGLTGTLGYDQGLDDCVKKRHWLMPGLRFEASYLYYTKQLFVDESRKVTGYTVAGGLLWTFPSLQSRWGCFVLAGLPGLSILDIENRDSGKSARSYTLSVAGIFGYEYSWRVVALQLHLRYTYLRDTRVAFHSLGGSLGLAFRLW